MANSPESRPIIGQQGIRLNVVGWQKFQKKHPWVVTGRGGPVAYFASLDAAAMHVGHKRWSGGELWVQNGEIKVSHQECIRSASAALGGTGF